MTDEHIDCPAIARLCQLEARAAKLHAISIEQARTRAAEAGRRSAAAFKSKGTQKGRRKLPATRRYEGDW